MLLFFYHNDIHIWALKPYYVNEEIKENKKHI